MGFPTEQDVYHRLRWDPRFDVRRCSIVVSQRPTGVKRVAFLEHDVDVVPWHRIVEFWIDDELAWSRPQRIDRLDELAGAVEAEAAATATATAEHDGGRLRVVTWNLLFDRYDAEKLHSAARWQDALDRVAALAPDVVVFAEVTPAMGRLIEAQPWVRGFARAGFDDLEPYGQVVLSRRGLANVRRVALAGGKRAVIAEVPGADVAIAAVHLTSNKKAGAADTRATQWATVASALAGARRWIVAGDFNGPPDELGAIGDLDAWAAVNGDGEGMTFDVARNALAAMNSRTGASVRMDRIHACGGVTAVACALVGEEVGAYGLHPSDHFGVVAELVLDEGALDLGAVPRTKQLALALVPPEALWGGVQQVRCADDRNWARWPPHVTLVYPFVGEAWLARAEVALRAALADVKPFELALDRVTTLDDRGQLVVLAPSARTARAAIALQEVIARVLGEPAPKRPFRPHLTLGRTGRTDLGASDPRIVWTVDRVLVLRERDGRYEPIRAIELAQVAGAVRDLDARAVASPPAGVAIAPTPDEEARALAPRHREALAWLRAALPARLRVEPFGSAIYAPPHAADLDLLIVTDTPLDLARAFGLAAAGRDRWRGAIAGVAVDIVVVDPATAPNAEHVLAAPADARALRDHVRAHGREAAFLAAWPEVRRFVHARALGRNGLGYFGSFGWAMLLAVPLCHDPILCRAAPAEAFAAWLRWLPSLRPHARVGFDRSGTDDPAQLYIAAPAPPSRNVARHLTAATARTLFAELARPALVDLAAAPPAGITIDIALPSAALRGAFEGAARGLVLDLERALAGPARVWGRFDPVGDGAGDVARITVASPADEAIARTLIENLVARLR